MNEIRRLGFDPVYDDSVFARAAPGYVAGTPAVRAQAIRTALTDRSIHGIIGVRGAYGSAQVVPLLNIDEIRQAGKPFIGYSDLTAILNFMAIQCGVVSFHGPMLDECLSRGEAKYDRASFLNAVCRPSPVGELSPAGLEILRPGEARGVLLGGTVTQLLATMGTSWAFDPPQGFVLFFEEVNERPYRLDRMLLQLRQTGILARASAIVIGELNGCDEPNGGLTGRGVMAELLSDFPGPVLVGFPSGHTKGPVFTLPMGVSCQIVANGYPRLMIEEAAVQ